MTIIAGGSRSNARFFAWHLQRTDKGQTVELADAVGLMGHDMHDWFEQMEAMSLGGNTRNYFYHFSLSPREGEAYTPEQEKIAIETALENLGLEHQPFFAVRHGGKDGRAAHYHVVALRVDLESGKAISDSNNYAIHMKTADQLETLFGHDRTERGRGADGPNPKGHEVQRGQESGIAPKDVKAEITALWHEADSGQAFAAALTEHDYILTMGNKGFLVVDCAGDEHLLSRRVAGARKRDIDARLSHIDQDALPTLKEARKLARSGAADHASGHPEAAAPGKKADPTAFNLLTEELAHAAEHELRSQQPPPAVLDTDPQPSAFGRFVRDTITVAEEAAPIVIAATEAMHGKEPPPRELSEGLTAFARFAQKVKQGLGMGGHDQTTVEAAEGSLSALEQRGGPAPPAPEFSGVWDTSERALSAANALAHSAAQPAAGAALEAEPTEFERITRAHTEAMRASGGDGLFIAEGVAWLAGKVDHWSEPPPPTNRKLTPFERITQATTQALRDNAGEPYTAGGDSLWRRSIALLAQARDSVTERLRDTLQGFAGRILADRNNDRADHERER